MAPNPNECVVLQLQQTTPPPAVVKIVTSSEDSTSEDGEHFYDASSDVGTSPEASTVKSQEEEGELQVPDDALAAQIVEQVEFYFSDAHILKDAFLLKHARRNRDGFISLKLITSFKKVKHVTKDWRVVAYACRKLSKQLEVNEQGTKVRRVAPLPDTDETSPSRTLVAIGLSADKATIESISELFNGLSGSIGLVRILKPGSTIPPDVRQCANRHPDILTSICAVVEFDQAETAKQALRDVTGLRLVELANKKGSNKPSPASSRPVTPVSQASTPSNRRKRAPEAAAPKSPYLSSSGSSTPSHSPQQRRAVQQQQSISRPKSASYSESSMSSSPPSSGSQSPWVLRRLGLAASESGRASPLADNRLSVPTNVLRMPNGPDGTRGFHCHLKPRSASAPEVPLMVTVGSV